MTKNEILNRDLSLAIKIIDDREIYTLKKYSFIYPGREADNATLGKGKNIHRNRTFGGNTQKNNKDSWCRANKSRRSYDHNKTDLYYQKCNILNAKTKENSMKLVINAARTGFNRSKIDQLDAFKVYEM